MRVEIIQGGRTLRQYNHEGRSYIEAPPEGDYFIRLTNDSGALRLAVISVDAIPYSSTSPHHSPQTPSANRSNSQPDANRWNKNSPRRNKSYPYPKQIQGIVRFSTQTRTVSGN
jgi:hypothetical protein